MSWEEFKFGLRQRWRYSKIRAFLWWFKYRLFPRHRYHTLRLGDPGYSDPRWQMIFAVMGIVERYVQELRVNWHPKGETKGLSDPEVVQLYVDWCSRDILDEDTSEDLVALQKSWYYHYSDLKALVSWWKEAKGKESLDAWSRDDIDFLKKNNCYEPEMEETCTEDVDAYLKLAINLRLGMWT